MRNSVILPVVPLVPNKRPTRVKVVKLRIHNLHVPSKIVQLNEGVKFINEVAEFTVL